VPNSLFGNSAVRLGRRRALCLLPVDRRVAIGALGDHPCFADEDDDTLAGKLLREMLAAGVSRWHPDPMKALADAKQKRTRRTIERAEQRLALARRKQNEVLADGGRHLLSRLANGARHLPSRLANGACHLPSRAALSTCDFPSGPAIAATPAQWRNPLLGVEL
jgi:hypothetical protein